MTRYLPLFFSSLVIAVIVELFCYQANITKAKKISAFHKTGTQTKVIDAITAEHITSWKRYGYEKAGFTYPGNFEKTTEIQKGNREDVTFQDKYHNESFHFIVSKNYSAATGKPYLSLKEFCENCSNYAEKKYGEIIASYINANSRSGHVISFFSDDKKSIFSFYMDTPSSKVQLASSEDYSKKADETLDSIITTFKYTK